MTMTALDWLAATRPRTLPAAVAAVAVGAALAFHLQAGHWSGRNAAAAALALAVALALQVGVNFANDYSDGVRGTDATRVGPQRLVGAGLVTPAAMRTAALASFAGACVAGLGLVVLTGTPELLLIGATCVPAAWFYTGGKHPYGYAGWGEVVTFVYFGLVATAGTSYAVVGGFSTVEQPGRAWLAALVAGGGCGAWACAMLLVNNLRDRPRDAQAGKHTLAVRLGDGPTRILYYGLIALAFLVPVVLAGLASGWVLMAWLAAPLAAVPLQQVRSGAVELELLPSLAATGRAQLVWALLLAFGLLLGG